LNAETEFRHHT